MRAVVDTNVVAYLLLGTRPFAEETRRFWARTREALAPASFEPELGNVVWLAERAGVLSPGDGVAKLQMAEQLAIRSVPVRALWESALVRATESGVAFYDTVFVELAAREGVPLATFDRKLLSRFPRIAARPGDLARRAT